MGSTTGSYTAGDASGDYVYRSQDQLALSTQFPVNTITPPESLASGIRDFGHEDVGRLQDVLEEDGERFHNNGAEIDVKDVVLIEESSSASLPPPEATTSSVQMVNVCSNKISLCNGAETSSRCSSFAAQMYLKDAMKEIFVNISNAFNTPELIVLEGANGAVAVHKSVISAYSTLVKEQLAEYPDCTTIYLPNYSQKIIRKVVEILYTGETFYSEKEKKDVNLIWDAMRQLHISFSDKSFYYHPVEYTAVKEEGEEEQNSQQQQQQATSPSTEDQLEVDQTEEIWHDDQSSNSKSNSAYSYCRVIRQPHPENPAKSVYVHSQYGEGRKIQRGMPALSHVNDDEIREKEKAENQRQVELILSKHKPVVIDLLEDDEDSSSPKKRVRTTQTYAAGTTVLRDEGFKSLVASGKMTLSMVKAATLGVQHGENNLGTGHNNHALQRLPPLETDNLSCVNPNETSFLLEPHGFPSVVIPPNRPEGTGITFMQKSPAIAKESTAINLTAAQPASEMPILQPVAVYSTNHSHRKLRDRKHSVDIIDIPRLDEYGQEKTSRRDNETDTSSEQNINGSSTTTTLAAAVIPGSKVNQYVRTQQDPSSSSGSSFLTQCDKEADLRMGAEQRKMRKRKPAPLMDSHANGEDLQRLRELYQQQQRQKQNSTVIVLGSTKVPVPHNVKVDAYVENMNEEEDDDDDYDSLYYDEDIGWTDNSQDPFAPLRSSRNEPSTSTSTAMSMSSATTTLRANTRTPRGQTSRVGKRGGRGGRGRSQVQAAGKPESPSDNKSKSKRGPPKQRGRGGGRRGVRGGRNSPDTWL